MIKRDKGQRRKGKKLGQKRVRKRNMARGSEQHRGGKFGVGRIERAHKSEEKTKTLSDSLHTLH